MTPTPLLLLDIDGVLNPRVVAGQLVLDQARGDLVRRLARVASIVWASSWSGSVTFALSRSLGIEDAGAVPFPSALHADRAHPAPTPKLHWVSRWLSRSIEEEIAFSTPVVWIDDSLRRDAEEWAEAQQRPTLLIRPDPAVGLTASHGVEVEEFLSPSAATPPRERRP